MRVMIVEDQTMIRSLLESYFRADCVRSPTKSRTFR